VLALQIEWTPALLQNQLLNASMHVNWEGYTKGLNDVLYSAYEVGPLPLRTLLLPPPPSLPIYQGKRATILPIGVGNEICLAAVKLI
jgi:hypothetical protein